MIRGALLTSLFVLACSPAPSPRPPLQIPVQPAAKPATERAVDRFSTLTFDREVALPAGVRSIQGFIGDGSRFWVRHVHDAWLHSIERGEPERSVRSAELGLAQYLDDSLALLVLNKTIYGHDTLTGARRFGTEIMSPKRAERSGISLNTSLLTAHVTASEVFVLLTDITASELVALDPSSGALLWRAAAEHGSERTVCTAAGRVIFATPTGYAAHTSRTGELAWSLPLAPRKRPLEPVRPLVRCGDGWVALLGVAQDQLGLVEVATGRVRASFPAGTGVVDARFAGDRLIAVARSERSFRLFAVDTERLELSWQSDPIAGEFEPSLRFIGAHALLATNDFVRIYEPERGQVVWHRGNEAEPIAFVERSGVPKLAFAAGERVAIFKAASKPTPTEAVTLRGTVTYDGSPAANIPVMAYGAETKTDASGHYSLAFEARGWLRVVALTPQPADVEVTLDGRGTYDVNIEAECPEGCE